MKANELRIGNYVRLYLGTSDNGAEYKEHKIETFYENGVHVGFGKCFSFGDVEPIPLTEEWLIKLGFKCIGNNYYLDYGSIEIGLMSSKRFYIQIRSENTTLDVKFVHQLQNLYFALTEQELTPQD